MSLFLVTGGAGFIGSHLVDALLARATGAGARRSVDRQAREDLPAEAELIVGDVADPAAVAGAMACVDGCFHLAAVASVELGNRDWLGTHRTNLTGAITIFDAARRANPSGPIPVVYASSAAVYGDSAELPLFGVGFAQALSAYGADKLGCWLHGRGRDQGPRRADDRVPVLQRVRAAPGSGIALFRGDLDLLQPHRPGTGASRSSATAARPAISSMSPMCVRALLPACDGTRWTPRCSMSARERRRR